MSEREAKMVRRVTTGHNPTGKAVVISDTVVAGDTVVQNGTRHAWRNFGAEPCRIVVFMVGVPRAPSGLDVAQRAG